MRCGLVLSAGRSVSGSVGWFGLGMGVGLGVWCVVWCGRPVDRSVCRLIGLLITSTL